ncbi:unnamed protein product [Rhizoctonia solani]|uniref:Endoplasmic reticulum-Golgi intermediate compartment protein 3 n=1 Tax=Rhizoctonia solani TaxID=456999 RepID=A0A8H3AP23_9AGAM|nr:unnamed protein product [Rhizoctonia solani]
MARGFFRGYTALDGFGKTLSDARVKTRAGAFLTILSATIILALALIEIIDYRRVDIKSDILVDTSYGQRMSVKMNITFPRVPCYLLSLDITDVSGDTQQDVSHHIQKTRLDPLGKAIHENTLNYRIKSDVEHTLASRPRHYCGSCYGGEEPEGGCCQTCESVRQAYLAKGWGFDDPNMIEQVRAHHYSVTSHERDIRLDHEFDTFTDAHGTKLKHGLEGLPGAFFHFDVSLMLVVHQEVGRSLARLVTSLCAVVGGVLALASMLDSVVYAAVNKIEGDE